jgi:hypothetical protein
MTSHLENFGDFTNLGIAGTNHNNNNTIIREYCQEQDYIFHFVSLSDSYTRELPPDIDRYRFFRVIRQTQMFIRDQLGEISGLSQETTIVPVKRMGRGAGVAYVARDVGICNGEITEGVALPLVNTGFLEENIEKHPNTIYVLAPFNHGMPEDPRLQKTARTYREFRDAMMQSPYPIFDLTDVISPEDFRTNDMVHYRRGTEQKIRDIMTSFGARLEEDLSAKPATDLTSIVRSLNKEIRAEYNL